MVGEARIRKERGALFKATVRPAINLVRETPGLREILLGYTGGLIPLAERFATAVAAQPDIGKMDAVLAHDTLALPAAIRLSDANGSAPIGFDAVEVPWPSGRTGAFFRSLPKSGQWRLRQRELVNVSRCRSIISPAGPMSEILTQRYGREVKTIHHSRWPIDLEPIRLLQSDCEAIIGVHGTHSPETGLLDALEVLSLLPENHGLVVVGRFKQGFQAQIEKQIAARNLKQRVIILPWMEQDRLYAHLQGCDIGLLLFDHSVDNVHLGLPHRAFDLMACGVPIVSSGNQALELVDHAAICTSAHVAEDLAKAILNVTQSEQPVTLREGIKELGRDLYRLDDQSWQSLLQDLELKPGSQLAVLACKSITGNARLARLYGIAKEAGVETTIVGLEGDNPVDPKQLGQTVLLPTGD